MRTSKKELAAAAADEVIAILFATASAGYAVAKYGGCSAEAAEGIKAEMEKLNVELMPAVFAGAKRLAEVLRVAWAQQTSGEDSNA